MCGIILGMEKLTTHTDQNYALRLAISTAADKMASEVQNWNAEKTARYYYELSEGHSNLSLSLEHP